jgi:hypothetical protein
LDEFEFVFKDFYCSFGIYYLFKLNWQILCATVSTIYFMKNKESWILKDFWYSFGGFVFACFLFFAVVLEIKIILLNKYGFQMRIYIRSDIPPRIYPTLQRSVSFSLRKLLLNLKLVFCIMFCRLLFILIISTIVCYVLLWFISLKKQVTWYKESSSPLIASNLCFKLFSAIEEIS